MYETKVSVATLPVEQWMRDFWRPEELAHSCEGCPDYGRVWSCPPGVPPADEAFRRFRTVHVIGIQVCYTAGTRAQAVTPEETDRLREETYGKVKRGLLESLLALEGVCTGAWTVAAGRCELCRRCARQDGRPCPTPERMRYSFSAFRFDLGRMAEELLGVKLLWAAEGLPEYDVAMAAFLEP